MKEILEQTGIVGYILAFLLIITTAIILYKVYVIRLFYKLHETNVIKKIAEKLSKYSPDDILLRRNEISTFIEDELKDERRSLQKFLPTMANISTVSTLIGLLGTVLGMIRATKGIIQIDNTILLKGISEALLSTVFGIVIAVPAIISYNYFLAKVENIQEDIKEKIFKKVETKN